MAFRSGWRPVFTVVAFAVTCGACGVTIAEESASPQPPATVENSLGMTLVLIPAGEFLMGSDETPESLAKDFPQYDPARLALPDERPAHRVRITRPFYFGRHEVTVGQFRRYLEASGARPESEADGTGGYGYDPAKPTAGDAFAGRDPSYSWRNPGFEQTDDHPVTNVTWNDAVAVCEWLGRRENRTYRLPTEAEWEYACRAGTTTRYHAGDTPESLLQVANVFDHDTQEHWRMYPAWRPFAVNGHDGHAFTAPVGSFAANAFGLHDMHGNVWEWCSDFHADDYYGMSPTDDPPGPATGRVRIRRGGSWHTWPLYARATFRNWNTPQTRYTLVGMRLVLETGRPQAHQPSSPPRTP